MIRPQRRIIAVALWIAAVVLAYVLGDGYIRRLPNHAGHFLVAVDDAIGASHARPRRMVVILVDGLSRAAAERLESVRHLASQGQCRVMAVGPITVSRPVYAVMSTGLEQDRAGCRNNDEKSPLHAESIWQTARRSGLDVRAVSGVPWWQELFPDGFSDYAILPHEEDYFARAELGDLTLIHPLYVDDAGHQYGAASPEYENATIRADREIVRFLERLDLTEDAVVLTSDHGHMSYGGHGGPEREIAEVTTCFAGRGVARRAGLGRMESRSLGPAVALLAGVPFPRNMRAVEDDLDVLFDIADTRALSPEYVADRRAAIDRFRVANQAQLKEWLGDGAPASWTSLYAREQNLQHLRLGVGLVFVGLLLILALWRRGLGLRGAIDFAVWGCLTIGCTLAVYVVIRGSLDFTSINRRVSFLCAGLGVCAGVAVLAAVGHGLVLSDRGRLLSDELTLVGLAVVGIVVHPFAFGWQLGFPLPGPTALFFPFFAPLFVVVHASVAALVYFVPRAAAGPRSAGR